MTDHADTITRALDFEPWWAGQEEAQKQARAALRALVAERDDAVRRERVRTADLLAAGKLIKRRDNEIQRLRDALADLLLRAENVDVPLTRERVSDIARAALAREEDT